jgi:hypothetical protein
VDLGGRDRLDAALVVAALVLVYARLAVTVDPVGTLARAAR